MAGPVSIFCGLAPMFGTLLTPSGGKLQSASLMRPIAFACDAAMHGERVDPFLGLSIGYNFEFKLTDVRLLTAGMRYRLQPNPAWAKDDSEQTLLRPAVSRAMDPFVTFGASYLNHTAYFLGDDEQTARATVQAAGAVLGGGMDWYLLGETKERDATWKGLVACGELRMLAFPLALGDPAFQAVLMQILIGARYIL